MNILIVSDDHFFSCGVNAILKDERINCSNKIFEYVTRDNIRNMVSDYDLVIVDITSIKKKEVVRTLTDIATNILFVIDLQSAFMADRQYFVSKHSSGHEFVLKIRKYLDVKTPYVSNIELKILHLSNAGHDMLSISSLLNLSAKSIYRLRYKLINKIGFLRYHPLIAAYCEMISMFIRTEKYP